jgi:hypothetical protein
MYRHISLSLLFKKEKYAINKTEERKIWFDKGKEIRSRNIRREIKMR